VADRLQDLGPGERPGGQVVALPPQGLAETQLVLGAVDLLAAELTEVLGLELAVEQHVAAQLQPGHQMGERDLGGVAFAAEHALAEEGPAQRDAIEPAHKLLPAPALQTMGSAELEQLAVELADGIIDPSLRMSRPGLGA